MGIMNKGKRYKKTKVGMVVVGVGVVVVVVLALSGYSGQASLVRLPELRQLRRQLRTNRLPQGSAARAPPGTCSGVPAALPPSAARHGNPARPGDARDAALRLEAAVRAAPARRAQLSVGQLVQLRRTVAHALRVAMHAAAQAASAQRSSERRSGAA